MIIKKLTRTQKWQIKIQLKSLSPVALVELVSFLSVIRLTQSKYFKKLQNFALPYNFLSFSFKLGETSNDGTTFARPASRLRWHP